jgi:hypothetical protein
MSTHAGIDNPSNVQSISAHSPDPVKMARKASPSGKVSMM